MCVQALGKLRDDAPYHSYEDTIKEIEDTFGSRVDEIFEEIGREPVASGSVAQVHRYVHAYIRWGLKFFLTESGVGVCFGWYPRHQRCWDPIAKHNSRPDVAPC